MKIMFHTGFSDIFDESVMTDVAYWNMFAAGDYQPEMCSRCKLSPLCDCGCREVAHILHGNPKAKDTSILYKHN